MRKRTVARPVRRAPKIYGNLQRRRRNFRPFWLVVRSLAIVGCLGGIVYVFYAGPFMHIHSVEVEGATLSDTAAIKALVPLNRSIWQLPRQQISQTILTTYPVATVSVLRGLPDSVRIIVHEIQPAALWYSAGKVAVLDGNGTVVWQYPDTALPAPPTPAGRELAALPHIYDMKNLPVTQGQMLGGTEFIHFIQAVVSSAAQYLPSSAISRFEINDTSYDVTLQMTGGLVVEVSSLADAGVQVRNLTRLLHQKLVTPPATVDLRIDRWAYVR